MKKIQFKANEVFFEKNIEEEYYMLGFADHKVDYGNYVIFQNAFHYDEDDVLDGTNTFYFECNGQTISGYHICKSVKYENSIISIELINHINNIKFIEIDASGSLEENNINNYLKHILAPLS